MGVIYIPVLCCREQPLAKLFSPASRIHQYLLYRSAPDISSSSQRSDIPFCQKYFPSCSRRSQNCCRCSQIPQPEMDFFPVHTIQQTACQYERSRSESRPGMRQEHSRQKYQKTESPANTAFKQSPVSDCNSQKQCQHQGVIAFMAIEPIMPKLVIICRKFHEIQLIVAYKEACVSCEKINDTQHIR